MFSVTFSGCAAGTELCPGLFDRERSEFGTFERLLWQRRGSFSRNRSVVVFRRYSQYFA